MCAVSVSQNFLIHNEFNKSVSAFGKMKGTREALCERAPMYVYMYPTLAPGVTYGLTCVFKL